MRTTVYISGPLTTSGNLWKNMDDATKVFLELQKLGFAPLCPHWSAIADPHGQIHHDIWMETDLPWVALADAVLRIPGDSRGADIEVAHAKKYRVPVFFSIASLQEHFAWTTKPSMETPLAMPPGQSGQPTASECGTT